MVRFHINRIGFDCGRRKNDCSKYPESCSDCVKNRIKELGFKVESELIIDERHRRDKDLIKRQKYIWEKYQDVLTIKQILIINKESGVELINFPISGVGIDVNLLTGLIQANITFSETEGFYSNNIGSDQYFYEFQYTDFDILLKNGEFCRICMILDRKASKSMRTLVINFLHQFEKKYRNNLVKFQRSGVLDFFDILDFIINMFNIELILPMNVTSSITIDVLEGKDINDMQRVILKKAKELIDEKQFFFIPEILEKLLSSTNFNEKIVLYEIYRLMEMNIIFPTTLETSRNMMKTFQEARARKIVETKMISSLISNEEVLSKLREEAITMSQESAKLEINQYIKKGKKAEKILFYQEARKEYEKALYLASGFGFEEDIGKISFLILEIDK